MVGVTIVVRAELSVRKFGRGGRAFAPNFRSTSHPRHRGFDPARPLLCGETSARRTGKRRAFDRNRGRPPGFRTEISVDHRDFKPKLRRGATETSALHGAALRHGGRRVSAHAAGMGPRPIGVRLSVCVRVSYPKAAPIGIEMVKRRTHERLQVQT